MIKGDMVKMEIDGYTVYGTILSIIDGIASVNFKNPSSREREYITKLFELDQLKKIGHP